MQPSLIDTPITLGDLLARDSRCARLAKYLIENRGRWIDGRELSAVGGVYAWRTRLSDLRQAPWFLTIDNRVRQDGRVKISEYRLA